MFNTQYMHHKPSKHIVIIEYLNLQYLSKDKHSQYDNKCTGTINVFFKW